MVELSNPTVVLTDTGELQLTNISRHCLLHAVEVLQPDLNLSIVLPKSGSHRIDSLCHELQETILVKLSKKKTVPLLPEDPLLPPIEIHKFCEGATGTLDFMLIVEKNFLSTSKGNIDLDAFHRCCWKYYEMEKKSEISFPRWFSRECTYRLWLIYNCVLEPDLITNLSLRTTNEVMKRLVEYCGYTWNPSYEYTTSNDMTFPEYLSAVTTYFEKFRLEMSLTCEVIGDMVDEIVHGVLKTGQLTKKGHKRKNWRARWFVLQRTVLRYYQSRDNMTLKGQLVLNGNTEVKSIPDKPKKKFCFHVTCGHTGTLFEIYAADQRMKHEWILAIKKAIALARVLDGSSKASDFAESLQGFYLLKYGTSQPALTRQDSTVRKMKFHATMKDQRKRLSGRDSKTSIPVKDFESSEDTDDQEQYVPMNPSKEDNITSEDSDSDDENRYVPMKPFSSEDLLQDSNCIDLSQSLPIRSTLEGQSPFHLQATRTISGPPRTQISNEKIPTLLEPTDEGEEGSDKQPYDPVSFNKENSKEEVKIQSRKSSNHESPLALSAVDDGREGSYIQLFHHRPTHSSSTSSKSDLENSQNYDEPGSWLGNKDDGKDNDFIKPTIPPSNNDKDESGEYEIGSNWQSTENNLYLTLLPGGPMSPTSSDSGTLSPTRDEHPAVPAHRKSSTPTMGSTTLSPLHKDRHSMSDLPPPPPPRSRGSSPSLNRVPRPLPRCPGESPPLRQYHNIIPKPSPAQRRATMAPKLVQPGIKEEVVFKRGSSYDELDYTRNSLSPPPIPPR